MKYLKPFNQINETLRSDEIDIVERKLDNFFSKLGFNRKSGFFAEVESPYYQITSDRDYMKSNIERYKNPDKSLKKIIKKHNSTPTKLVASYQKDLDDFKYGDIFIFTDKNSPEITKNLLHLIDSMGYFVSTASKEYTNDFNNIVDKSKIEEELSKEKSISISIEPTYDSQVDFKEEYLYHTTDKKNLDKIMKFGLAPKSKNTRSFYPERIFLSPNLTYNKSIQNQLGTDKPGEYVDLKIRNFSNLKLYKDVRFKGGFYTYNNIPPNYIEVINK